MSMIKERLSKTFHTKKDKKEKRLKKEKVMIQQQNQEEVGKRSGRSGGGDGANQNVAPEKKQGKEEMKNNLVKLLVDEEVGLYRVTTTVLGMGSFGIVYKGLSLYSPYAPVAVKIISKSDLNEHRRIRLKSEIELLKSLDHPGIVKLLEVYESDERVYLVFEYKNGDLYNYIQTKGPVTEMVAMEIFRQLVDAVDHCHKRNIVHLDIKLENILIDDNTLEITLADFGFATYFEEGAKLEKWCGSPFTVAPEIITRTPYDARTVDIWALGSVLYTILNGSYPFQAPTVNEVLQKTKAGKINPFHSSVGYSVRDIIVKILTLDMSKRITMEQLLVHPWYRLAAGLAKIPDKVRISQGLPARTTKHHSPRNILSDR
eukprot:TRINITY_DN22078_c0_g1_i1.p1 TRINITY_DN22078_c0_g1~~TRINITY_DN22078_c0_g1_i1.p1  ORF type:complete len:373 (-),score=83.17 TRINITY_DN22078_c0_g1_i1:49-1167(-)